MNQTEEYLIGLMRDVCEELGLPEEKGERCPVLEALNQAHNRGAQGCAERFARQGLLRTDPPAPTEPLVHRGTFTIGPEPDGSVRQVAIVGVAQGAYLSRCLVCELAGGCLCEGGPTYASPRPETQHRDDGGGNRNDNDGGA